MTKGEHPKKHRRKKNLINKQRRYYQEQISYKKQKKCISVENTYELSVEEIIKAHLKELEKSISLYKKYKELVMPQIERQSSELEKRLYTSTLSKEKLEDFENKYKGLCSELIVLVNSYKKLENLEKI